MSKRDDILNTALELFIANGIENTPTSLISREAGVATGTLFHHFRTKEELINALYIDIKKEVIDSARADLNSVESIKEKVELFWVKFAEWSISNSKKLQFLQMAGTSKYIEESTLEHVNTLFNDTNKVIAEGYERGIFKIQPPELFQTILHSLLYATVSYFIEHPDQFDDREIRRGAFESYWRALTG